MTLFDMKDVIFHVLGINLRKKLMHLVLIKITDM